LFHKVCLLKINVFILLLGGSGWKNQTADGAKSDLALINGSGDHRTAQVFVSFFHVYIYILRVQLAVILLAAV